MAHTPNNVTRRIRGSSRLLAVLVALSVTAPVAAAKPSLFGSTEVRSKSLRSFPKWSGVLARYFAQKATTSGDCTSKRFNRCHQQRWDGFIAEQQGRDLDLQLQSVNSFINKAKYIVDPINWGVKDYWATPAQFLSRFGDCEDYAIAKYLTLRRLGVPPERMRIVILQDLNLRSPHAVLAVFHDDRILILDNQVERIVDHRFIRHYRPIYSLSEQAWWLHRPASPTTRAKARARSKTRARSNASGSVGAGVATAAKLRTRAIH